VKLTPDGQVKVLDFGLARAGALGGAEGSLPSLSHSPTLAAHGTAAGVILGTAAYMSPEQARGKSVDRRADIWAFGVILWEMLTGRRLFAGETVSDTLAAVLRAELEWKELPALPPALDRLLRRCLARDPKARLHDVADARLEIADALAAKPESAGVPAPSPAGRRALLPWALAAALAVAATGLGIVAAGHLRERPEVVRFEVHPPANAEFQLVSNRPGPVVVSPDGRSLAFSAVSEGQTRLFVRGLDATEARPLAGTEGAEYPFWSPDSRSLGFFASDKLKRVEAAGGPPLTLCGVQQGKGGSWSPPPGPDPRRGRARGQRRGGGLPRGRHRQGDPALPGRRRARGRALFPRERTLMAQAFDTSRDRRASSASSSGAIGRGRRSARSATRRATCSRPRSRPGAMPRPSPSRTSRRAPRTSGPTTSPAACARGSPSTRGSTRARSSAGTASPSCSPRPASPDPGSIGSRSAARGPRSCCSSRRPRSTLPTSRRTVEPWPSTR
jgi:hypothetical protein